jgi:hypothetical protein
MSFLRHADAKYGPSYFAKHFGKYKVGSHLLNGEAEVIAHLRTRGAPV